MVEQWIEIGSPADFAQGLTRRQAGKRSIVIGHVNGRLRAFHARCPHAGGPLELSEVDGSIVTCPLHAWRFDLEGGGTELHGYRSLPVFDTKIENDKVYVKV